MMAAHRIPVCEEGSAAGAGGTARGAAQGGG
jgi:hypothetical protein